MIKVYKTHYNIQFATHFLNLFVSCNTRNCSSNKLMKKGQRTVEWCLFSQCHHISSISQSIRIKSLELHHQVYYRFWIQNRSWNKKKCWTKQDCTQSKEQAAIMFVNLISASDLHCIFLILLHEFLYKNSK